MIVRISDIQEDGLTVANAGEFVAPFTDPSWRLERLHLHLAREGDDVLVTGEITAAVPLTCGRCLEEFRVGVRAAVDTRYVPRPAGAEARELGVDDLDLDFYDHDELNLDALVETETTLALPMKPLCRDDCRGLCPACGGNRNVVQCACDRRPPDPRLAALRDLAARLNH
ncbi:MAG: DUF177 domain-containing protein [Candidatus Rokubacteria bacterium]|nr:DUF177 domain-containing protein [Candidatus Rokubacteria bacterium]